MRSKERILLILVIAFMFALTPFVAMADNLSQSTELDHSDYGMDGWIDSFDTDVDTPGIQIEGDAAYGYYTGTNPGFNDFGMGLWTVNETDHALGAPAYTTPCPDFNDPQNDEYGDADCDANADSDEPQTAPNSTTAGADWDEWEIPILDDVLAKMWDFTSESDRLTQTLDILFYLDPGRHATVNTSPNTINAFIDQTLDQDLADYQGDIDSYVANNGVGIVNRLVQVFGLSNTVVKADAPDLSDNDGMHDADYIDQWVLSYTKDIAGYDGVKIGIVSSYSGWFSLDRNVKPVCPIGACGYEYTMGHDEVNKVVPEVDGHPNDDIPDP